MIITNRSQLIEPCIDVSLIEAHSIIHNLENELKLSKIPGVGLAANQIGLKKKFVLLDSKI